MTKLVALFEIRLTETNPAPPVLHAFTFEGSTTPELKKRYTERVAAMKKTFKNHKYFSRLALTEDQSDAIRVRFPSLELPELETA